MAKDMHWFKFFISEYLAGDIVLCSDAAQGVFVRVCCLYWAREGNLNLDQVYGHLPGREALIGELISKGIIKTNLSEGVSYLLINFLDEQRETWVKTSAENSQNGKLGGRGNTKESAIQSAPKATPKAPDKAVVKPPQSQLEKNKILLPADRAGEKDHYSLPTDAPTTSPPLTGGSSGGVLKSASTNPQTIKTKRDFLDNIATYKYTKFQIKEIDQGINEINDKHVFGCYMQFRRSYKTEDNKHKRPSFGELMDLIEGYQEDADDES